MKRLLVTLLVVLLTSCYSYERDCKKFQTGVFVFETYLNGEFVKTRFTRNDSIEIDHFQGKTDTSSVRWINDCEYILTNLHPENRAEKKPIHIKILTTNKNSYTFEFSEVGSANKQQGTARKVGRLQ